MLNLDEAAAHPDFAYKPETGEEAIQTAALAAEAGKGDVRQIGAPFRLQPGADQRLIDLAVEMSECVMRPHAGP